MLPRIRVAKQAEFDLPRRLNRLGELAHNLWWAWTPEAIRLFVLIDRDLWEKVYHNPFRFLREVDRSRLTEFMQDRHLLAYYDQVMRSFDDYLSSQDTWFNTTYPQLRTRQIAYFSMEFGLHETLALYAGGLGVLSGDHLKEASDLGLPLVGIGFLYTRGYFAQRITEDGWQEKREFHLDLNNSPILPVLDENDAQVKIKVDLPGRTVTLQLWRVQVGRVPLLLLDSNAEENTASDRNLTANLYSGSPELRISQEILLGIGGVRALRALGFSPDIWHMNEGHSAFMALERAHEFVAQGKTFDEAKEIIYKTNIFTTHTPVPAGNDEFPTWLVEQYFANYWTKLGIDREQFMGLAHCQRNWGDAFSMPVLALRLSEQRNAVSELHGKVTRQMWHFLWADHKVDDVPITHVTNGVHTSTWMARRLRNLLDRYFPSDWRENVDDPEVWASIESVPDAELWAVRRHLKRKLVAYIKERARQKWIKGGFHPVQVIAEGALLDPYALTIGFARRFAPYKRATLVLRDLERLLSLLNRPNMPVQIIFAGKSHPDHEGGKLLIQEVYRTAKKAENGGRIVFLEEYDMNLARYLVQGVDVWLNTPRRPNEASGTSGQKAALNGALNFSVLDGWWREGFNGRNGWSIGEDADPINEEVQDARDSEDLYNTLEKEIIPLYYQERAADGLPSEWLGYVKESMRTLAPQFSMRRMLKDYMNQLYLPGLEYTGKEE
ncbi:MAG: alpha-glucan family phosphorylase [Anaerolineales bacterium]